MNNNFESHKFDRRSFLKASGIVGAAGLLAACGGKDDSGAPPLPVPALLLLHLATAASPSPTWSPGKSSCVNWRPGTSRRARTQPT